MASHKISVALDASAIKVDPERLVMTSDDDVQWEGTGPRGFHIVFDSDAAFGQRELRHPMARDKHRPRARGRFKYSIVAADDPGLVLDPEVVIEEPPTKP